MDSRYGEPARLLPSHPEIGRIPERRHVAQIVVADRELAESLRRRLLAGESLFRLARVYQSRAAVLRL